MEPGLAAKGLSGGAIYYDGWGDDARLTLENIVDTAMHGGAVVNYAEVEGLAHEGGRSRRRWCAIARLVGGSSCARDASSMRQGRGSTGYA